MTIFHWPSKQSCFIRREGRSLIDNNSKFVDLEVNKGSLECCLSLFSKNHIFILCILFKVFFFFFLFRYSLISWPVLSHQRIIRHWQIFCFLIKKVSCHWKVIYRLVHFFIFIFWIISFPIRSQQTSFGCVLNVHKTSIVSCERENNLGKTLNVFVTFLNNTI